MPRTARQVADPGPLQLLVEPVVTNSTREPSFPMTPSAP